MPTGFGGIPLDFQRRYRENLSAGRTNMTEGQAADYYWANYAGKPLRYLPPQPGAPQAPIPRFTPPERDIQRIVSALRSPNSSSEWTSNYSVHGQWTNEMLDAMSGLPQPKLTEKAFRSYGGAMLPTSDRVPMTLGGNYGRSYYSIPYGTAHVDSSDLRRYPYGVYGHEQFHGYQQPPERYDARQQNVDVIESPWLAKAAHEVGPSLVGGLTEYNSRRQSGGAPVTTPMKNVMGMNLEWMYDQAKKHGAFSGKSMDQILAENPQFVSRIRQESEDVQGDSFPYKYDAGSIRPQRRYTDEQMLEQARGYLSDTYPTAYRSKARPRRFYTQ